MNDKLPPLTKAEFSPDPVPMPEPFPEPLAPPSETRRLVTKEQYFSPNRTTPSGLRRLSS